MAFIRKNWKNTGGKFQKSLRLLRDSGIACEQSRFRDILNRVKNDLLAKETTRKNQRVRDEVVVTFIRKNWKNTGGNYQKSLRLLRDSGIACEQSRFRDILNRVKNDLLANDATQKNRKVRDEIVVAFIRKNWKNTGGKFQKSLRLLRDSGIACEQNRFRDILNRVKNDLMVS